MALEARVGLLGVSRIASHSSVHIRDGFIEALKLFCTRAGAIDEELLYHILRKVEILDGDAAADGQLANVYVKVFWILPCNQVHCQGPMSRLPQGYQTTLVSHRGNQRAIFQSESKEKAV